MASLSNEEIAKAGKHPGLEIWRIENMEMVPVPKEHYGHFFIGDSYIVLQTRLRTRSNFSWNIHFWLGNESSQDEQGAAAILSTQLDDYLGGSPIQYREVQNKESNVFRGYFKNGITYKKGGVQSGFKHARTNVSEVKRILHLKGRRSVRATEVELDWSALNQGDVFIIEIENDIFQWNGSKSNRYERLKGCELASSINSNEKGGKGKIKIVNEGDPLPSIIKKTLRGSPNDVRPEVLDEEKVSRENAILYHVSSDTGTLMITRVGSAPFEQKQLFTGDCFILDNGANSAIYVWKGKQANKEERSGALNNAMEFIKKHNYHPSIKIQVMAEGAESVLFTQFFKDWRRKDQTIGKGKIYRHEKIAKVEKIKFNVKMLHDKPKLAAEQNMVDDGSGKVEVWRVEGKELVAVNGSNLGQFFAGDSYVILYTYRVKSREQYIIYTWQGLDSTKDEIAASAFHSTILDDEYNQKPVQCRVVQGKEPQHFLAMFRHPIIISLGGFDKKSGKNIGISTNSLYQVRSSAAGGAKLIEVKLSSRMLNSNDAFLLNHDKQSYVWVGLGANPLEIEAAVYGAGKLNNAKNGVITMNEGEEVDEFWTILGGKEEYASSMRMQEDLDENPPRLFIISNARGRMFVEEVPGEFAQSDLEPDDVMMLDTWNQVFIWIGEGANVEERKEAPKLAMEYIAEDPRGRDRDCPVITVKMNAEPVTFTGFFPSWDDSYFEKRFDYIKKIKNMC